MREVTLSLADLPGQLHDDNLAAFVLSCNHPYNCPSHTTYTASMGTETRSRMCVTPFGTRCCLRMNYDVRIGLHGDFEPRHWQISLVLGPTS